MSEIDFNEAGRFLESLAGYPDASFCFQTFDDSPAKRRDMAWCGYGVFAAHRERLVRMNAAGAGVFVTVNATDGRGRKIENVIGLRALFIDGDDADRPAAWHVEPDLIVRRGAAEERRWHAYWMLRADEPLALFGAAQHVLAWHYRSDHRMFDLPRVMRIPGFVHRKGSGRPVVIERIGKPERAAESTGSERHLPVAHRRSIEEIVSPLWRVPEEGDFTAWLAARGAADYARHLEFVRPKKAGAPSLPAPDDEGEEAGGGGAFRAETAKEGAASPLVLVGASRASDAERLAKRVRAFLRGCAPAVQGQDGSGKALAVASALVNGFLLSVGEAVSYMAEDWNIRCSPPWSDRELLHKCESAKKKNCGPGGEAPGWLVNDPGDYVGRGPRAAPASMLPPGVKRKEVGDGSGGTDNVVAGQSSAADIGIDAATSGEFVGVAESGIKADAVSGKDVQARPLPPAVKLKRKEVTEEVAEAWIDGKFRRKFRRVKKMKDGMDRDKAMLRLFGLMAKYLPKASPLTADRIKDLICDKKRGLGMGKKVYDQCLRRARADLELEHGDEGDWLRFARFFLNERRDGEHQRVLVRWRQYWYEWTPETGCYTKIEAEVMESVVCQWMSGKGVPTTDGNVSNFLRAVRAETILNGSLEAPCWINSQRPQLLPEYTDERRADGVYVALKNGILDLDAVTFGSSDEPAGKEYKLTADGMQYKDPMPHTPDYFSLNSLPYEFQPVAGRVRFEAALATWQPDDPRDPENFRKRALQDFGGYLFMPGQMYKTILICVGPGDDGKSQLMEIFRKLVGDRNCAAVGLHNFDPRNQFGRVSLMGKMLATAPDQSKVEQLATGIMKAISGGDTIGVDRKNKEEIDARINAKIMITCNSLPGFNDDSEAIWRRLVILRWNSIPVENQRPDFAVELIREEMPGIFLWALEGFCRLRAARGFRKMGILLENVREAKTEIQHEREFFEESIEVRESSDGKVYKSELIQEYIRFCKRMNYSTFCHGAGLGKALKKWVKEQLLTNGRDGVWVANFVNEKSFESRDKSELDLTGKRSKRREYYRGINILKDEDEGEPEYR